MRFLVPLAKSPATNAPMKAATAGSICARSINSKRKVLAKAPINAAEAAKRAGLLNITEKPNTPQKPAIKRKIINSAVDNSSGRKPIGCKCKIIAITHGDKDD